MLLLEHYKLRKAILKTGTDLLKECLGSIIVLNVLIHSGLFRGKGCAVVSKQQGFPQSNLCRMEGELACL